MSYKWLVTAACARTAGLGIGVRPIPRLVRVMVETKTQAPWTAQGIARRLLQASGYNVGDMQEVELPVDEEAAEPGLPMDDVDSELLDLILDAAGRHGEESLPEHRVGDLEAALLAAWNQMKPHQRRAAFEAVREQVESWQED